MNHLRRQFVRKTPRPGRARGFSLIELLVLLGILGLIALAAGRLFEATIRLGHANAQSANDAASFDAMTSVLRADAWSAAEMTIGDDGRTLTLRRSGQGGAGGDAANVEIAITWTLRESSLVRDDGGAGENGMMASTWPIGAGATFAIDGPSLVLRVPSGPTFAGGDVRVVSQVKLVSGRPS